MKTAFTHPESKRDVVLSDGFVLSREEAEAKGYTVSKWPYAKQAGNVATRHPHRDGVVILQHGVVVQEGTARTMGYKIANYNPAATIAAALLSPHRAWRSAVMASPEAKGRDDAVAELLTSQSETGMSLESARAFLRGLPTEQPATVATVATKPDPRAARLAEIDRSMAAFNRGNGHSVKAVAPSLNSVDPVKLKRLTEIRLGVLTQRMGRGDSAATNEHKKLQYAMSVHHQTGMPLANVFTQMGIDTSKMLSTAR